MLELLQLIALPVVTLGAVMGTDVSPLLNAYSHKDTHSHKDTPSFEQVGKYGVGEDSAAEIIASDGKILAYSNSDKGSVDFVDITDPTNPISVASIDVGGEPTSVAIRRGYAIAAVNTSESYTNPSGQVVVIDLFDYEIVKINLKPQNGQETTLC